MRANEFITERFSYQEYLPKLKRLISDTFYDVVGDEDNPDPVSKVNAFFYELQNRIDDDILAPLIKKNPLVINNVPIRHLTVSFRPKFTGQVGRLNIGSMSAKAQQHLNKYYPGVQRAAAGVDTTAKYIKSHVDFTGEAEYGIDQETKNAIININIHGTELANMLFQAENSAIATAALGSLTSGIIGKLFHEIKHFMQSTKVIGKFGYNAQVNKFYTGDPKKIDKNKHYEKTKSGYWLNTDEMDAWAANAAADINNVFGKDKQAIVDYMNATAQGQAYLHNGVPVNTTLNTYRSQIFNPRYQMNTDRQVVWRRFVKDVYKDLQMHG